MSKTKNKAIATSAALTCAAAILLAPIKISAAEPSVETTPAKEQKVNHDSCAAAFATVMAQYMKPELEKRFKNDTAAINNFMRGVHKAFEIKSMPESYHFGVRNGFALIDRLEPMQTMGFPISNDAFLAHLEKAIDSSTLGFNPDSADEFLRSAMSQLFPEEKKPEPLSPESQEKFLSEQKQREGVIQTASGLLFEIITEGEGNSPALTDNVKITYTGRLADGTVFDHTDETVQFPVNRLVKGFTEGLMLMKPGGKYRIFIPAHLGYGDKGAADVIPPGAALDFTVNLLEIIPSKN